MRKLRKYGVLSVVLAVITVALLLTYGCKCQWVTEVKCEQGTTGGKCSVSGKLVCSMDKVPPADMLDPMIQVDMFKDLMIINDIFTMDFVVTTDRGIRIMESIPFKQAGKPLASRVIKNAKSYRLVPMNKTSAQQLYAKVMKNANKTFSLTMTTKAAYKSLVKTATPTRLTRENIRVAGRLTSTEPLVSSPITFR
jgi:hypothetical protein